MFQIISTRPSKKGRTLFWCRNFWSDRQPFAFAYLTEAAAKGVITLKRLQHARVVTQDEADEISKVNTTIITEKP